MSGPSPAMPVPAIPIGLCRHLGRKLKRKTRAQPRWPIVFAVLVVLAVAVAGLFLLRQPVQPAPLTLAPVQFAALERWTNADAGAALAAFRRSCDVILREPSSRGLGGAGYAGNMSDWRQTCHEAGTVVPGGARAWFEHGFIPFELHTGTDSDALFTGYYEPGIAAESDTPGRLLRLRSTVFLAIW